MNDLKEGRGSGDGEGSAYKPWINVQDFASLGRATKAPGWKTERSCQFLSDNELRYLEWSDIVTDIREQFPLLEIEKALKIAEEIGVK